MRLRVDAEQCMGHGRCVRILPDLLDFDDEGYVTIRGESLAIPEELRDLALDAEGSCPEGAISLVHE
jgi:ferredoxin